jgi:hypothetical protein
VHGARLNGKPSLLCRALDAGQTEIFVDGDGDVFPEVLRFLRDAQLPMPADEAARQALYLEARRLEIDRLTAYLDSIKFMTYEMDQGNQGGRMAIPRGLRMLSYGPPLLCFRWAIPSELQLDITQAHLIWNERIPGVCTMPDNRPNGGESDGKAFLRRAVKDVTELLRSKISAEKVKCDVKAFAQEAGVPVFSDAVDHAAMRECSGSGAKATKFKDGDPALLAVGFRFANDPFQPQFQKLTASTKQKLRLSAVEGSKAL